MQDELLARSAGCWAAPVLQHPTGATSAVAQKEATPRAVTSPEIYTSGLRLAKPYEMSDHLKRLLSKCLQIPRNIYTRGTIPGTIPTHVEQ